MEIELGLLGAVALMGIALQLRILKILHRKLSEIKAEQARMDEEQEAHAAELFARVEQEKAEWERDHPTLTKHGRQDSTLSSTLLKDNETAVGSPDSAGVDDKHGSTLSLDNMLLRPRYQSGVSTLMDGRQSPGAIPALDLGLDLESDVPKSYLAVDGKASGEARPRRSSGAMSLMNDFEDLKEKEKLLSEIQAMRRSIEVLKSETPPPSNSDDSRRPSFSSRRTLSQDLESYLAGGAGPSNLRPRATEARSRVQSMDLLNARGTAANAIGRPTSVPLQTDESWEQYIRERKLLTPPSGVSPPIPTTPLTLASPKPRLAIPSAVTDALLQRQRRESSLSFGRLSPVVAEPQSQSPPTDGRDKRASAARERSSDDIPIALRPQAQHKKSDSQGSWAPGIILPPRNRNASSPQPQSQPDPARVMSFEELEGRHRERLRQLQQPLTQAEKEQADLLAAKSRWERAKQLEKQAVLKRQAEQAAAANKQAKEDKKNKSGEGARQPVSLNDNTKTGRHSRSLSADVLAAQSHGMERSSSKRMSTMKVEDWQKRQLDDVELGLGRPSQPKQRRESSSRRLSGVPFPDSGPGRSSRESRRLSGMLGRDPVN